MKKQLLLLALLGGCGGPTVYLKDGATQESFQADIRQCEYEAQLATAGTGASGSSRGGLSGAYASGIAAGIGQFQIQQGLVNSCLEARGYRKQQP